MKIPCWGALWPRPQAPRPDSLVVTAGVVRARWPFLPGCSFRSQRYIRYAPRVRVCAGWHALTVPGAAQCCGTSFQRLVCVDPPVRKCLRISERVRALGAHKGPRSARPYQGSIVVSIEGCKPSRDEPLPARLGRNRDRLHSETSKPIAPEISETACRAVVRF